MRVVETQASWPVAHRFQPVLEAAVPSIFKNGDEASPTRYVKTVSSDAEGARVPALLSLTFTLCPPHPTAWGGEWHREASTCPRPSPPHDFQINSCAVGSKRGETPKEATLSCAPRAGGCIPRLSTPMPHSSGTARTDPEGPLLPAGGARGSGLPPRGSEGVALSPHPHGEPPHDSHLSLTPAASWSPGGWPEPTIQDPITDKASRRPCPGDQAGLPPTWTLSHKSQLCAANAIQMEPCVISPMSPDLCSPPNSSSDQHCCPLRSSRGRQGWGVQNPAARWPLRRGASLLSFKVTRLQHLHAASRARLSAGPH